MFDKLSVAAVSALGSFVVLLLAAFHVVHLG